MTEGDHRGGEEGGKGARSSGERAIFQYTSMASTHAYFTEP